MAAIPTLAEEAPTENTSNWLVSAPALSIAVRLGIRGFDPKLQQSAGAARHTAHVKGQFDSTQQPDRAKRQLEHLLFINRHNN